MSGVAFLSTGLGGLISAFRGAAGVERRSSGRGVTRGAGAPRSPPGHRPGLPWAERGAGAAGGRGLTAGSGGAPAGPLRCLGGQGAPRGPPALLSVPAGSAPQTLPLSAL